MSETAADAEVYGQPSQQQIANRAAQDEAQHSNALTHHDPSGLLLPYQLAWVQDESEVAIGEKGRRTGFSWGEACASTLTASKLKSAGGEDCWYMSYNREMGQQFILDCLFWARVFNLAVEGDTEIIDLDSKTKVTVYLLRFNTGHRIGILPSKPEAFRSKQGRVIIDETAFVKNLEALVDAALALLIWGGHIRFISTHNGTESQFNELVTAARSNAIDESTGLALGYSLHTVTFGDAIAQGLYKRICRIQGKQWTPEAEKLWENGIRGKYRSKAAELEELDCIPRQGGGRYLPRILIEERATLATPVLEFIKDASWAATVHTDERTAITLEWLQAHVDPILESLSVERRHGFGQDFALKGDRSVMACMEIGLDLKRRVILHVELAHIPHEQQRFIMRYLCDRLPNLVGIQIDKTGNGSDQGQHAEDHYGLAPDNGIALGIQFSRNVYAALMPPFKAAFEDGMLLIPQNDICVDDLTKIELIGGVPQIPNDTGQADRHADAAVAYLLAFHACRGEAEAFGYVRARVEHINTKRSLRLSRPDHRSDSASHRRHANAVKHQRGVL